MAQRTRGAASQRVERRARFLPKTLGRRLVLLNLALLLLPIGGMLYLRSFERTLLEHEERAMVAEARWVAAALGSPRLTPITASASSTASPPAAPDAPDSDLGPRVDSEPLTAARAAALLRNRERPLDARVRVVDVQGKLLADTVPLARRARVRRVNEVAESPELRAERESWIYRTGASVWSFLNFLRGAERPRYRQEPPAALGSTFDTAETTKALAGGYGSATRLSSDGRFLVLSSAVPIRSRGDVVGAVIVSRTTLAVLEALDRVRLDVFRVLLACLAVALVVTFVFARTTVAPLVRLRDEAEQLLDARGRIASRFSTLDRSDEIGDLARALAALSERLDRSVGELDRFASELAHELKNPLAAIRAAGELAADVQDPAERQRLRSITEREVGRAERLLSELQAMAALEKEEGSSLRGVTELGPFLVRLAAGWSRRRPGVDVVVRGEVPEVAVALDETRLARVVENLLDNAVSLAPEGSAVELAARKLGDEIELDVADRGPGIPEEHRERIFGRFFSWRPQEGEGDFHEDTAPERAHLGLGLDIARTIARRAGGELEAANREDGPGALFRLTLPRA